MPHRIESAAVEKQAALAAMYQTGYRLATIWAGAGVLWIAARARAMSARKFHRQAFRLVGVDKAYLAMAASMLVGVVAVFLAPEPARTEGATSSPSKSSSWRNDLPPRAASRFRPRGRSLAANGSGWAVR